MLLAAALYYRAIATASTTAAAVASLCILLLLALLLAGCDVFAFAAPGSCVCGMGTTPLAASRHVAGSMQHSGAE